MYGQTWRKGGRGKTPHENVSAVSFPKQGCYHGNGRLRSTTPRGTCKEVSSQRGQAQMSLWRLHCPILLTHFSRKGVMRFSGRGAELSPQAVSAG